MHSRLVRSFILTLSAGLALLTAAPLFAAPALSVSPPLLTFVHSSGTLQPHPQTISVTGASGEYLPVSVATNGASWLGVSVSFATTPSIITVSVYPLGLPAGAHQGTITVTSAGAANSPFEVPVTLHVVDTPPGPAVPSQLSFSHVIGSPAPDAQTVMVYGPSSVFSVTATAAAGSWLLVGQSQIYTPSPITVRVDPTGLFPGVYQGYITVTHYTSPVVTQVIGVTLQVTGPVALWPVSGSLAFQYRMGDPDPAAQTLQLAYYILTPFYLHTESGGWLHADPVSGFAPGTVRVWVDPAGLSSGTYRGDVVIETPGFAFVSRIPVTLTVTGGTALTASPLTLNFEAAVGGTAPPSQPVSVAASPSANFTANVLLGKAWLAVTPAAATTPATVQVSVNHNGLAPGTYRGNVVLAAPGASSGGQLVAVTLTVTGGAPLAVAPASLRFDSPVAGANPPAQTVSVTAPFAVQTTSALSGGWLRVTPASGVTPLTATVSVETAGMTAGTHSGSIVFTSPSAQVAPVTLDVTLSIGGGVPEIRAVSNGAGLAQEFAPGSTITVFGRNLGPATGASARLTAGRPVETALAGTRLLLNGVAAPLLYVQSGQLNGIVPSSLDVQSSLEVQVESNGALSEKLVLPLADAAPVLFTADGSGRGQASVRNESGMVNGPLTPAARGSVISLFGSGGGLTEAGIGAPIVEIEPSPLRAPVTVWIGGVQADVLYAGQAPGMVSGAIQINVRVPRELVRSGDLALTVRVGEAFSQNGVTVAVQ